MVQSCGNNCLYPWVMPAPRGAAIGIVNHQVWATDHNSIDAVAMMTIDKGGLIAFRGNDWNVGTVQRPNDTGDSSKFSEFIGDLYWVWGEGNHFILKFKEGIFNVVHNTKHCVSAKPVAVSHNVIVSVGSNKVEEGQNLISDAEWLTSLGFVSKFCWKSCFKIVNNRWRNPVAFSELFGS